MVIPCHRAVGASGALTGYRWGLERKAALLDEVARQFERTVGEVVNGVAAASSQLHTTATRMASSAEEASRRTGEVALSMEEANAGATAAAAASDEFALSISEISRQAASSSELARLATVATGEAEGDPEMIAHILWASLHGGLVLQMAGKVSPRVDPSAMRREAFATILRGLRPKA